MPFINVGAEVNGVRPKSKKALREALRDTPEKVYFDGTSNLGPQFNGPARDIPEGVTLTVCGPDPLTKRNWWASVKRNAAGKITIE